MKVFITGQNGFLAKNLILRLQQEGYQISSSGRNDNIVSMLSDFQPDYIFHIATEGYDQSRMFESNVQLMYTLLEYCRINPIKKLIVFGSSSEYGRKKHPLTEKDALEPESIYEGTKAAASMLCRSYAITYKIPTLLVRPMSVYGPHEKMTKLMPRLFTNNIQVLNKGVHDWIYIDDFVNAVMCCMKYTDTLLFDIINIGLGVQRTNEEVVKIAEKLLGQSIPLEIVSSNSGVGIDSDMWVCDPTHLRTKYGYVPQITLEEGMFRYLTWMNPNELTSFKV